MKRDEVWNPSLLLGWPPSIHLVMYIPNGWPVSYVYQQKDKQEHSNIVFTEI